ncbi:MAG: CapA family protein [Dehalococcoidia bacterium]
MIYDSAQGNITIAVAGDSMITRPMSMFNEERFLKLVDLLRSADASVVNLEMLFHDYEMSWENKETVSFQVSDPANLKELKWMGFKVVTTANNHSYDYSEAGFLTTLRHCKETGLLQAGGGRHLDEARAPAYLDTAGGRVAVMSATTTFSSDSRAGLGRPEFPGKPGVNALRHDSVHQVTRHVFDALREANRELGYQEREEVARRFHPTTAEVYDHETELRFLGGKFRLAEEYGVLTSCNKDDLTEIGNWIRGAKKASDWPIYGVHCHESGDSGEYHGGSRLSPPNFLQEFAHFTIDQGCSLFFAHGPHFLRGIEIYKNRPIFYSLGNFIFQNETVQWVPEPVYRGLKLGYEHNPGDWGQARSGGGKFGFAADPVFYRSAVALCRYANGDLKEIQLHPIDLGFQQPMSQRGRPVMAEGPVAQEVLKWLQDVSKPYGTEISIEGDIGVIRL